MNAFSKLHPFTIFCYYVITLILLIWVGHPMLYLMMFVLMFADYSLWAGEGGARPFFPAFVWHCSAL